MIKEKILTDIVTQWPLDEAMGFVLLFLVVCLCLAFAAAFFAFGVVTVWDLVHFVRSKMRWRD